MSVNGNDFSNGSSMTIKINSTRKVDLNILGPDLTIKGEPKERHVGNRSSKKNVRISEAGLNDMKRQE